MLTNAKRWLWRHWYANRARCLDGKYFVVYTMGHVGTVSIRDALCRTAPYSQVEVAHYLTIEGIHERENVRGEQDKRSRRVRRFIQESLSLEPLYISAVRDPVARDVTFVAKHAEVGHFKPRAGDALTVDDLQEQFIYRGPGNVLNWLDKELGPFLDVDVYDTPFDKSLGYQVYQLKKGKLLIIRQDKLAEAFPAATQKLSGVACYVPARLNRSGEGRNAEVCNAFRSNLRLDDDLLNAYYNSKYARHFYTKDEINALRKKWARA